MDYETRKSVGNGDLVEINKILTATSNNSESFEKDLHLYHLIGKPWGYEYRVYCDCMYDVWCLHIKSGHNTSMHCHILKDTVLICLSGIGYIEFLDESRRDIKAGDVIYLGKGVFHQTHSTCDGELNLIEVENPRNKFDLLRYQDSYGRENTAYERESVNVSDLMDMRSISPGAFIRDYGIKNKFSFEVIKINKEEEHASFCGFYVSIDITDYLTGEIVVFKGKDNKLIEMDGKNVLVISKVK